MHKTYFKFLDRIVEAADECGAITHPEHKSYKRQLMMEINVRLQRGNAWVYTVFARDAVKAAQPNDQQPAPAESLALLQQIADERAQRVSHAQAPTAPQQAAQTPSIEAASEGRCPDSLGGEGTEELNSGRQSGDVTAEGAHVGDAGEGEGQACGAGEGGGGETNVGVLSIARRAPCVEGADCTNLNCPALDIDGAGECTCRPGPLEAAPGGRPD